MSETTTTAEPATSNAPEAFLVTLSTTGYTKKAPDHEAAREITETHGAQPGVFTAYKMRIVPEAILPIQRQRDFIRNKVFYKWTCPYGTSTRILTPEGHDPLMAEFSEAKTELYRIIDEDIREQWEYFKNCTRDIMRGAWIEGEYPTFEIFRARWTVRLRVAPFDIEGQSVSPHFRRIYRDQLNRALDVADMDSVNRVMEPLLKIAEKLSDPKAIFRDSLIENLRQIRERIPALNVRNNSTLSELYVNLGPLTRQDPEMLRSNALVRQRAAEAAMSVAGTVASQTNATSRKIRI